ELLTAALGSGDASRRPTSAGDLEFSLRLHDGAAPGAEVTIRGEGGELTLEGLRLRVTSYDQHTVEDDGFPGLLAPAGWAPPAARTGSGPLSGDPVTAPALDPDPLDPSTPYTPAPEPPGRTAPRYDAPPVRGLLATPSAGPGDGGTRTAPAGPDGGRGPAQEPTGPGTDDGAPLPADAPVTGDRRPGPGTGGNPSAPSAEAPGTAGGLPGPDPDVETTGPIDLSADRTRPWG
ncbi:hypothetical protein Q7689_31400, partial [Nocardiopsis tropica]|nr:hypothetical protein [Nocardiopsis tropica]